MNKKKKKARIMRSQGFSYSEIMEVIDVPKSTLSGWVSDIKLGRDQIEALKKRANKKISQGRDKAVQANKEKWRNIRENVREQARKEFKKFKDDNFFVFGISMYWAEGTVKSKYFSFINSDPLIIELMMEWVDKFLPINKEDVALRLYIHKPYEDEDCEKFWSEITSISVKDFKKTVYKPTSKDKKINVKYKGCLRISIFGLEVFERVATWQKMIYKHIL